MNLSKAQVINLILGFFFTPMGFWVDVKYDDMPELKEAFNMAIKALEQEPRKGHWLGDSAGYKCDRCGHDLLEIAHSIDYIDFKKPKYCPNCGCAMVEPQESEEV